MTHATIVADAQDSLVTLNRVVSLLRGRCFAVVSFTAAKSHRPGIARLTIVVDAAHRSRIGDSDRDASGPVVLPVKAPKNSGAFLDMIDTALEKHRSAQARKR